VVVLEIWLSGEVWALLRILVGRVGRWVGTCRVSYVCGRAFQLNQEAIRLCGYNGRPMVTCCRETEQSVAAHASSMSSYE